MGIRIWTGRVRSPMHHQRFKKTGLTLETPLTPLEFVRRPPALSRPGSRVDGDLRLTYRQFL